MASKWPFWLAFAFLLWICELTHGVRYPVENDTINPEVTPMYVPRGHKKGMVYEYTDCYGIAQDLHGKDNPCVFPFIYRGTVSSIILNMAGRKCILDDTFDVDISDLQSLYIRC
jgi:hypothetical protein